jgi:AMMECR1 domain-containing protein
MGKQPEGDPIPFQVYRDADDRASIEPAIGFVTVRADEYARLRRLAGRAQRMRPLLEAARAVAAEATAAALSDRRFLAALDRLVAEVRLLGERRTDD